MQDLSQINLIEAVSRKSDVNNSFSSFYNKINNLLNKHAPLKPISKCKIKRLSKPWITKGIRKSIKIKNSPYCSGDTDAYKIYCNKVLKLTRISKYFEENLTNIKKNLGGYQQSFRPENQGPKRYKLSKMPTNQTSILQLFL